MLLKTRKYYLNLNNLQLTLFNYMYWTIQNSPYLFWMSKGCPSWNSSLGWDTESVKWKHTHIYLCNSLMKINNVIHKINTSIRTKRRHSNKTPSLWKKNNSYAKVSGVAVMQSQSIPCWCFLSKSLPSPPTIRRSQSHCSNKDANVFQHYCDDSFLLSSENVEFHCNRTVYNSGMLPVETSLITKRYTDP